MNQHRPLPGPEIYDGIEFLGLPFDLQGWNSEHPIVGKLFAEIQPNVIFDVGVWKGASAVAMAKLAPKATVYALDSWLGGIDHDLAQSVPTSILPRDAHGYPRIYHTFLSNVAHEGLQKRIVPVVQTSLNGARLMQAHGIVADFIRLDASHEGLDVLMDLDLFVGGCLRPGGILLGDDLNFPGVSWAVGEFCTQTKMTVEMVPNSPFYILRKPAEKELGSGG